MNSEKNVCQRQAAVFKVASQALAMSQIVFAIVSVFLIFIVAAFVSETLNEYNEKRLSFKDGDKDWKTKLEKMYMPDHNFEYSIFTFKMSFKGNLFRAKMAVAFMTRFKVVEVFVWTVIAFFFIYSLLEIIVCLAFFITVTWKSRKLAIKRMTVIWCSTNVFSLMLYTLLFADICMFTSFDTSFTAFILIIAFRSGALYAGIRLFCSLKTGESKIENSVIETEPLHRQVEDDASRNV